MTLIVKDKKSDSLLKIFNGKYSNLFSNIYQVKFNILVKKQLILQDFGKLKTKI